MCGVWPTGHERLSRGSLWYLHSLPYFCAKGYLGHTRQRQLHSVSASLRIPSERKYPRSAGARSSGKEWKNGNANAGALALPCLQLQVSPLARSGRPMPLLGPAASGTLSSGGGTTYPSCSLGAAETAGREGFKRGQPLQWMRREGSSHRSSSLAVPD
jgi:hypothetical protein